MSFTKRDLRQFEGLGVPDLIGEDCRLLIVGINPGLWTAATQTHFCHPSNRFYPALFEAGLIDWSVETDVGMTETQREDFTSQGMGITNLVNRATVRASELTREELKAGGERLGEVVARVQPRVVAVAGLTAYREAFADRRAAPGRQSRDIGESELWVVPNPSGLNAHETVQSLAGWYRKVAEAAGIT